MKKVLINFAHPSVSKSRVNKAMLDEIKSLPEEVRSYITINDLYYHYPDFSINAVREKKLLLAHDIILFHHPIYWYSSPSIIKEWQDVVLELGFAYGPQGDALKGKVTQNIISTGGPHEAYTVDGYNRYTVEEFMRPFEQTANLCQMKYIPPFALHGSGFVSESDIKAHSDKYKKHILALIADR